MSLSSSDEIDEGFLFFTHIEVFSVYTMKSQAQGIQRWRAATFSATLPANNIPVPMVRHQRTVVQFPIPTHQEEHHPCSIQPCVPLLNTLRGEHTQNQHHLRRVEPHVLSVSVGERNPEFFKSLDAILKDYVLVNRVLSANVHSTGTIYGSMTFSAISGELIIMYFKY